MRVIFYTEELDVDLHYGSCSRALCIYVEGRNRVVAFYQNSKKIVLSEEPSYLAKVQKLFTQPEYSEGDEVFGKLTLKVLEIKEIKTLADETVLILSERIKNFVKDQELLIAEILAYFPGEKK